MRQRTANRIDSLLDIAFDAEWESNRETMPQGGTRTVVTTKVGKLRFTIEYLDTHHSPSFILTIESEYGDNRADERFWTIHVGGESDHPMLDNLAGILKGCGVSTWVERENEALDRMAELLA